MNKQDIIQTLTEIYGSVLDTVLIETKVNVRWYKSMVLERNEELGTANIIGRNFYVVDEETEAEAAYWMPGHQPAAEVVAKTPEETAAEALEMAIQQKVFEIKVQTEAEKRIAAESSE